MLIKSSGLFYQSEMAFGQKKFIHGFSTIYNGDMSIRQNRQDFIYKITGDIAPREILPEQVHRNTVAEITFATPGGIIKDADGIIYRHATGNKIVIGIMTADCVPLLFYDIKRNIYAVVHAGWKGTSKYIARYTVNKMKKAGSAHNDIYVIIGPYIGNCCYQVDSDRKKLFDYYIPDNLTNSVQNIKNKYFLDLGLLNRHQIIESGISLSHIDSATICTSCSGQFYSYRKSGYRQTARMFNFFYLN